MPRTKQSARPATQPYCFLSGSSFFSTENILLDTITEALRAEEAADGSDNDSELEESSSVEAIGRRNLPETTKDALRVSQEVEWTSDLVLLKWHGLLVGTHGNGDENGGGYLDFEQEDDPVVRTRNAVVPSEVRVHFNLRPDGPISRYGAPNFVIHSNTPSDHVSSPKKVAIGRYDGAHTFVTKGSFGIAQMATNGRLTPYALYMLQFDLRGLGADGPHGWETATDLPATSIQKGYYIDNQFSADLQCDDCIYEMSGSGLRSVDYGPMGRAMKTRVDLLSLPLPHPLSHQRVRHVRRKMHWAQIRTPSDEQNRFWRNLFGSSDMNEQEKLDEAWMGKGNLWCIRRPDRFPVEKTLASSPLLTFSIDIGRNLTGLEALPWPIFHLLSSYLSPKDFWTLLFLSKSLHATLLPNIDKLVHSSIRQTRPHLLPCTPLKIAGHQERRSKEEEYWVSEWAKGGIQLGVDDERSWRTGKDVDRIPWMRYARETTRCPSMRNRRRIWGIALQLEELAERAGYL